MNATGLPGWLRVADIEDSGTSHSTTKGMASSIGFSDATSSSFFTTLTTLLARVDRVNFLNSLGIGF